MKSLIKAFVVVAAFVPVMGFANTVNSVFAKSSNLPEYMKEQILNTILTQCPSGVSQNGLNEKFTTVTPVQSSDSYVSGLAYETHFLSHYYYDSHPRYQEIIVKSFFGRTADQEGEFSVNIVQAICPEQN